MELDEGMNDHPLPALRNRLLNLHKLLMNAERAAYARREVVSLTPLKLLQLLTEHESFTWLRQLSQLVVMMDEAMEEKPPISNERKDALVAEARLLLAGAGPEGEGALAPGSFAARLAGLCAAEAAVATAYAEIRQGWA